MMANPPKSPRWFAALCIILALPLFQFPALLSATAAAQSQTRVILWIYPFYAVMAAYLAWQCYGQRRALAWILLGLLVMSHVAIRLMVFPIH